MQYYILQSLCSYFMRSVCKIWTTTRHSKEFWQPSPEHLKIWVPLNYINSIKYISVFACSLANQATAENSKAIRNPKQTTSVSLNINLYKIKNVHHPTELEIVACHEDMWDAWNICNQFSIIIIDSDHHTISVISSHISNYNLVH